MVVNFERSEFYIGTTTPLPRASTHVFAPCLSQGRADAELTCVCVYCAADRGKRKKAKPPPAKTKPKVAQIFDCPFCGKTQSCSCKMDVEHSLGSILCDSCGAKFDTRISRLSDPIDVYSEWIDQYANAHSHPALCCSVSPRVLCDRCDAVNAPGGAGSSGGADEDGGAADEEEAGDQDF